jgi:hypothetical protein
MKFEIAPYFIFTAFVTLCCSNILHAQDKKLSKDLYIAAAIPDSLKDKANSVTRYSSDQIFIKGLDKIVAKHHSIITILNEKGDDDARLILYYDKKFNSVNSVEMVVYNAGGIQVKKYHKSDMYDRAAIDGMSIITDSRLLALSHTVASYPATIEVTFETSTNSYLDLGQWQYQEPEKAVQYSEYSVLAAPESGFRYKNSNTTLKPQKTMVDGMNKYTWTVSSLKAVKPEEEAVSWQVFPHIFFATKNFQYGGLPGDISNWQIYGKWQQALNADVCTLSAQRIEEIKAMTANLKSDKEKARFLYSYLQQNMRYVSIQLGIGGLKPFPAMFVDQKKYGDCKALSNYMSALLKAVNIPSYYAMIRAGANEEPADATFPSDPFNHVILCVPFKGDTTWLECTSNTNSFGSLGAFTENRNALVITENGGVLINTPKSTMQANQFNSEVHITFNDDGGAKAKVKILSTGGYRDAYINMASLKTDEQKEHLIRTLNMKQPTFIECRPVTDNAGVKELAIDLEFDKFCDISAGNKMFYRPRAFDLWETTLPVIEHRKNDFYFEHPMQKSCITVIDLPPGFEIETLPANQSLHFSYGNYDVKYAYDAVKNQVTSTTLFNLNNQRIPAAKYTEMQQYMETIAKAQNKKLVIRRKA